MSELLPCPFCGGDARMIHNTKIGYWAGCKSVCIVFVGYWATEELAIAAWNERAPQPMPVEVQPPEHVREYVAMVMEGEFSMDELRFVVYSDTSAYDWLVNELPRDTHGPSTHRRGWA